ncbi:DUF4304 domain-containing protein [Roseobacter sp. MED193]|uniref:DUF4304 domain-containing protein n=1 Tax=Roseobacter sp. MED193 TaxID=314262 RepID=UPI000587A7F3|nr:DUF4304 domain-containing protein [Roseobacter sp. MED193]
MFEKLLGPLRKPKHNADRKSMETALKAGCIPALRNQGFKGTFPNFYREHENFVALVNFQFFSSGGSFCINLGYADPERRNVSFEPEAEPRALRVTATRERSRLGSGGEGDNWFSYGKTSYGEFRGSTSEVNEIAEQCAKLFISEAEGWWLGKMSAASA